MIKRVPKLNIEANCARLPDETIIITEIELQLIITVKYWYSIF